MKYKGTELKDISDIPQLINPPRKMLVWCAEDKEPRVKQIYAIGPSTMDLPVRAISDDGRFATRCYKYCAEIPKFRRATTREVSKWLAKGNGEVTTGDPYAVPYCKTSLYYDSNDSDNPCPDNVLVRKWDDNEWHEPTLEYMGIKEVG